MKKYLRFILPILLIGFISLSCSAQKTFGDLADIKGVSSVYIGKTLLKVASTVSLGNISVSDIDINKLAGQLTSIEILSCSGKKLVKKVNKKADKILKEIPLETISDVNKDGSTLDISGIYKPGFDILTTLVVKVLKADSSLTIIMMTGEIDMQTLESALTI